MSKDSIATLLSTENSFDANAFLLSQQATTRTYGSDTTFKKACEALANYLDLLFERERDTYREKQHDAIIGDPAAKSYFLDQISNFLRLNPEYRNVSKPQYYRDLEEALFQSVLGFGPMSVWFANPTEGAQVNGTSVLFDIGGRKVRQPFSYDSLDHVNRLIRSITLRDPSTQLTSKDHWVEVEMLDGTRVSIVTPPTAQEPIITFRQYTFTDFSFKNQARKRTIPKESVSWFETLSKGMLNTIVTGPVKSGKSTMLKVIFGARDPNLTVITLERDSFEIRLKQDFRERSGHIIPIRTSLDEMKKIFPSLLRMDAHYIIVPEVRSGEYELLALSHERGNGYLGTYHSPHVIDIPDEFARLSLNDYPSRSYYSEFVRAAKSLHVVISMTELADGRKVVTGVYGYDYDRDSSALSVVPWMTYDKETDSWSFYNHIPKSIERRMRDHSTTAFESFSSELASLATLFPNRNAEVQKTTVREGFA